MESPPKNLESWNLGIEKNDFIYLYLLEIMKVTEIEWNIGILPKELAIVESWNT